MIATPVADPSRRALLLDTNVWIASAIREEPAFAETVAFLARLHAAQVRIAFPDIVRLELACALARRAGAATATTVLRSVVGRPGVHDVAVSSNAVRAAALLGMQTRLRAFDALLVTIARVESVPLVTWDQEIVRRGGGLTPPAWLARHDPVA